MPQSFRRRVEIIAAVRDVGNHKDPYINSLRWFDRKKTSSGILNLPLSGAEPVWSQWGPDVSTVCDGVSFTQSRYDIGGNAPIEYRQAFGTKPSEWSTWSPEVSSICEGVEFTQTRIDSTGCLADETRLLIGTKPSEWTTWSPEVSTVCEGVEFTQIREDIIGCQVDETRQAFGTKPSEWTTWSPEVSTICTGVEFTQIREDITGCLSNETRQAFGTSACAIPIPDFYAWFDANDPESMDISPEGNVTTWYDKGLRGNDLVPRNSTLIPYGTREKDGLHVMDLAGVNQAFGKDGFNMLTTSHSWFIVAKVDSRDSDPESLISFLGQSGSNRASWQLRSNLDIPGPQWCGLVTRSVNENAFEVEFRIPPEDSRDQYYLYEIVFDRDTNSLSTYLNGTFVETQPDNEPFAGTGKFSIGVNRGGDRYLDCAVGEVVCLDSAELVKRQEVQDYLLTRWNLI